MMEIVRTSPFPYAVPIAMRTDTYPEADTVTLDESGAAHIVKVSPEIVAARHWERNERLPLWARHGPTCLCTTCEKVRLMEDYPF